MSARDLEFIVAEQDAWTLAPADEAVTPRAQLLLSWAQWRELRDRWPQGLTVGVVFPNDGDVNELLPDLPRLALVALHFPKWTDGRAYSQARLLRVRHRFQGQLRAVGDVIPDMSAQLYRTGFDAMALRPGESIEVAARMLGRFPAFYQGDAHERRLRFARATPAGLAP
jgi:uncharacterized protein (DUF934 family)